MTSFIVSCPCPCGVRFPVDSETMRVPNVREVFSSYGSYDDEHGTEGYDASWEPEPAA